MTTSTVTREVIIDEKRCHGCGYCVQFCPTECLELTYDRVNAMGYAMPVVTRPQQCNACGFCARMCPHWAIEVYLSIEAPGKAAVREKVAGPPRLAPSPPLTSCRGCQHPTIGRIIAEVLDELGLDGKFIALDAAGCGGASTFDLNFGHTLAIDEHPLYLASMLKRTHPSAIVFAVQGEGDRISTGTDSIINALAVAENLTLIACNDTNYGTAGGQLLPIIPITTPKGRDFTIGRYPIRLAELAATFEGVVYSARGAITSPEDYQQTRAYVRTAFQKQLDAAGFSFVEILCACSPEFGVIKPVDCLKWIRDKMIVEFPLGEFKNVDRAK